MQSLGSHRRSSPMRASARSLSREAISADVAQPVELRFCKPEVRGSSPLVSSNLTGDSFGLDCAENSSIRDSVRNEFFPMVGCPSGQWERAVNPPAYAYGGSNPPPSTNANSGQSPGFWARLHWCWRVHRDSAIGRVPAAGVAQLVERQPSKLNVVGSNPISRS